MAALEASLRTQTASVVSVGDIGRNINALVCQRTGVQQFATFFLVRVAGDGRRLTYCNADGQTLLVRRVPG